MNLSRGLVIFSALGDHYISYAGISEIMFWFAAIFYGIRINLRQRTRLEMDVENSLHLHTQFKNFQSVSNSFI